MQINLLVDWGVRRQGEWVRVNNCFRLFPTVTCYFTVLWPLTHFQFFSIFTIFTSYLPRFLYHFLYHFRWRETVLFLTDAYDNILCDVIVSAGTISYLGKSSYLFLVIFIMIIMIIIIIIVLCLSDIYRDVIVSQ